jgi:ATP-dependent DNA ligase
MPRTALRCEPLPRFLAPMLLRPGVPRGDQRGRWALELKWDGMRAQLEGDGAYGRAPSQGSPRRTPAITRRHELLLI